MQQVYSNKYTHTNKGNSLTNLSLHAPTCISNPTHPSHYTTPWLSTNTAWPRAGVPEESEIPKQADFHICAQGQSFFVCNLILKQGGLCGCLRLLPCLPREGLGQRHRGRSWSCCSAVAQLCCQQEIWEWLLSMGKDACTQPNNRNGKFTYRYMQKIDFFPPKFVFSQGESSLYNSQIAVWGLRAPTPLHNKFFSKASGGKVHTISTPEKCVASGKAVKLYTSESFQFNRYTVLPQGVRLFPIPFQTVGRRMATQMFKY